MRRPKQKMFGKVKCGASSVKKLILLICFVSLGVIVYFEVRARYIYLWQTEEDEAFEDNDNETPVVAVDVYAWLLLPDTPLVASRYKIEELLGAGFVSRAYSGIDIITQEKVVLKFTYINVTENTSPTPLKGIPDNVLKLKALQQEYTTYQHFHNTRLLQSYFYGDYSGFKVLVTQQGGKSLIQLQELNRNWSQEDVYQIARNIISDLQQLHGVSYLHNDMHTGNIAFNNVNQTSYKINLIDFNSCKNYRNPLTLQHIKQKRNYFRVPTHRFSPPCYFQKQVCSRRDDLYSLGYILVMLFSEHSNCSPLYTLDCPERKGHYWFGPSLPWVEVIGKQNLIDFMKNTTFNILNAPNDYRQQLPDAFRKYFEHLETLEFSSKPDYEYLVDLFV
jgi:serine/threonine protein kinase